MKALFVCLGNTCRSPMAEALFNFESSKRGNSDEAKSAGLRPYSHVMDESVKVMDELGIDISKHKPRGLSSEMVEWADKIILLDSDIKDDLINLPSNKKNKIILWNVEDPYFTSMDNYRKVRNILHGKILELISDST